MDKGFKASTAISYGAVSVNRGNRLARAFGIVLLATALLLTLLQAPAAFAADPPFTNSHPITITVVDPAAAGTGTGTSPTAPAAGTSSAAGAAAGTPVMPKTGDSPLLATLVLVALAAGLALVGVSLHKGKKRRRQRGTTGKAGVSLYKGKKQRKKARFVMAASLLTAALALGSVLGTGLLAAQAAPAPGIAVTIDRGIGDTATVTFTTDATATLSRYLDIVAALEDALPGITLSIEGDTFDHAGDTAVKQVDDPQDLSGGTHAITLTAKAAPDVKAGAYTATIRLTLTDKRTTVTASGLVAQGRAYDGTRDIAVTGTPVLTGVAPADVGKLALSNITATVANKDAGAAKPVAATAALTGDRAYRYLLAPITGLTATIAPKALSFTGTLSATKPYDGTTTIAPASIQITSPTSFSGLVGSEGFTLSAGNIASASFADAAAGANKPVTYTGAFSLTSPQNGALAANYTLTPPTLTGTISATAPIDDTIRLEVIVTAAGQTLTVNKYFTNAHTVDWGDGSPIEDVTANLTHAYAATGTYTVTLASALTGQGFGVWTFGPRPAYDNALIPFTQVNSVIVSYMPPMTSFMTNATTAPDHFFSYFNNNGAIKSLPAGSFDTSNITTAGDDFFRSFATGYYYALGAIKSLPAGSFDTSNITTAGDGFFRSFNYYGALTSLPAGSFKLSAGLTTTGDGFFYGFNDRGTLASLPAGSFDISNITTEGGNFFYFFNFLGALTSLPDGSFRLATGLTTTSDSFFYGFNDGGSLTSLPAGSFDTSNITTVGDHFFEDFNGLGFLTSLPAGSFDTSNITTEGDYFFATFNSKGALTSLPAGSFKLNAAVTTVDSYFFFGFNYAGSLTSLPVGSFDTSNIVAAGDRFFAAFNVEGALTSLPAGSFDISNITTEGGNFFYFFNQNGALTSLPNGSFKLNAGITTTGDNFFQGFNFKGALTSLPASSFDTSNITTVGSGFFSSFNSGGALTSLPDGTFRLNAGLTTAGYAFFSNFNDGGALTSLPAGSFDTSNITAAGYAFFANFNKSGSLTSLPAGSFDTSRITSVENNFFSNFNESGSLTSLPAGSFDTSNITGADDSFFANFNKSGALTSLPAGSFDTSRITSVESSFFSYFNDGGSLTSLPAGSFDTSNITTVTNSFFSYFNQNGVLTSLPASFKWPKLDAVNASWNYNFYQAFYSPAHTLDRDAQDIINGCAAPNSDRNTFSSNQPGYGSLPTNWRG